MAQNTSSAVMQQRIEPISSLDYFPTPPWATRAFMAEFLLAQHRPREFQAIWEPACGEGHMAAVLSEFSRKVVASDVHDYGRGYRIGSFVGQGLDVVSLWPECQWVITNPPFNLAVEFAERALDEAQLGVALLVRSAWAEGGDRYQRLFKNRRPSAIVQYAERVPMVKGRYDPAASTATPYAWFVWEKAGQGLHGATHFHWIPPGACERNLRKSDLERWAT